MKIVRHDKACTSGKRRFADEHDAKKALGRAKTRAYRKADRNGTRRGLKVESRYYYHAACDGWHLTNEAHSPRLICTEIPSLQLEAAL